MGYLDSQGPKFSLTLSGDDLLTSSSVLIDPMIISVHSICSLDYTLYSDTKQVAEITK